MNHTICHALVDRRIGWRKRPNRVTNGHIKPKKAANRSIISRHSEEAVGQWVPWEGVIIVLKPGLIPGVSREATFKVTEAMCPAFDGQVVHRVCATWTLVHYMELAGRRVLVDFLEPDEEGVGSHVTCDHLAPAPIGTTVRVVATATMVSERELVCEVTAHSDDRQIASGRTVQKIFPRAVLARMLGEG